MRSALSGRAGTALAFVLGLLIATAGTATASKLITGKQIKNGSIGLADISPQAQRALKGKEGPAGPQGPPGGTTQQGLRSRQSHRDHRLRQRHVRGHRPA